MEELERKIKTLWDNGESLDKIARQLGIKRYHALKAVKKMQESGKLDFKERKCNKKKSVKALMLWESGMKNPYDIARELNTSKSAVYHLLRENNISIDRPRNNYIKRKRTNIESLSPKTKKILEEIKSGKSKIQIAIENGVSRQWVYSIESVHIKGEKRKYYGKKSENEKNSFNI